MKRRIDSEKQKVGFCVYSIAFPLNDMKFVFMNWFYVIAIMPFLQNEIVGYAVLVLIK